MENWTPKAVTALYVGNRVHENNWHAIKADPRFGPWLVDFSEDDLRNKVKADEDMIAKVQVQQNQEGMSGVNQPKNIWQKIKAYPQCGSILSGKSEDDVKNKFNSMWTERAVSAFYVGQLVHGNNWHAIKADPRFAPWLVNFSADDLRNHADMFAKCMDLQQTGLSREGLSGVNQPKNIWQQIKADSGSILSGKSEDDMKNKIKDDLEFFGVNLFANDCKGKVNEFENWKTNEAFTLFLGVIKYGMNNWDAIKADSHLGPLLVKRDAYSCSLKYQYDLDKLERDILARDIGVSEPVRASRGASARGKKKGKRCRR